MKKNTTIRIKFLEILVFILIFTAAILSNTIYMAVNLQEEMKTQNQHLEQGVIKLKDNYDGQKNISIMTFFKEADSLEKMKNLHKSITQNKKLNYYEILKQDVQFIGPYNGNIEAISGAEGLSKEEIEEHFINQKWKDGEVITSLNSIQFNENANIYFNMNEKVAEGRFFSTNDYNFNENNTVPVILGSSYNNMYKIGDSFKVLYLGIKELNLNVIGFLKEDSNFNFNDSTYSLNKQIIMPSLNIESDSEKDKSFSQILYSLKDSGYISYDNRDEYKDNVAILDEAIQNSGLNWGYIGGEENPLIKNPINLSVNTATILKNLCNVLLIVVAFFVYKLEQKRYRTLSISKKQRELLIFKTKEFIVIALQIFFSYLITSFVLSKALRNHAMYSCLIYTKRTIIIIPFILLLVIIFSVNFITKKIIKNK